MSTNWPTTPMGACRSCGGAYKGSDHTSTCHRDSETQIHFKRGASRRAGHDSRNSAAARANQHLQESLVRHY
jgi:hypothetical protein